MLYICYMGVPVVYMIIAGLLQGCDIIEKKVLQRFYRGVTEVLQRCYRGFTDVLQGC